MAQVFNKSDLLYTDYKSTNYLSDDPKITGKPDSTYLNRKEAYEMAYFIDRYMQSKGWSQKSTGQKIEKFLKNSNSGKESHAEWIKELNSNFKM